MDIDIRFFIFMLLTLLWIAEFIVFPSSKKDSSPGRGSFYLVLSGVVSSITFSVIMRINQSASMTPVIGETVKNAALVLYGGGVFLRYWSSFLLGRNFSRNIKVSNDQELVSGGPYRFLRHPLYMALMVLVVSVSLFLQSLWGVVFSVVIMGTVLGVRIKEEEKIMEKNIGSRYVRWKNNRSLLIPFIF